jgi:hypothetical protein
MNRVQEITPNVVAFLNAQDEIDKNRSELIEKIEGKLQQKINMLQLFSLHWKIA